VLTTNKFETGNYRNVLYGLWSCLRRYIVDTSSALRDELEQQFSWPWPRPQMEALHFRQISTLISATEPSITSFFSHAKLFIHTRQALLAKTSTIPCFGQVEWSYLRIKHRPTPYLTNHQPMPHNNIQCVLAVTLRWLRTHQPTRARGVRYVQY
jgi:hypothetical protein